jgi:Carboxypeptidase regulatory-like domain
MPAVRRKILLALATGLLSTLPLVAQEYRATILGKITDPAGSVVPNADIAVTNTGTGFVTPGKSDDSGNYTVPFLVPGTYSVKVTATGFSAAVRENIELHAGDKTQVDMPLELGQTNQAVTVQASGELLQTATASTGEVIDSRQTRDLPVLGRNPFMLAALTTGVNSGLYNGKVSQLGRPFDGAAAQMSVGGIGSRYLILLNGIPNNPPERASAPIYLGFAPSPEAVEEVNVQTNLYDAQYGHTSGAVLNTVLRSGTNQLHGSLYEYFRNTVLNANTFESNAAGTPVAAVHWNQPGFMFAGPVFLPKIYQGKDKTFFMVSWERVWNVNPSSYVGSVPTQAERNGDFSGLTQANGQPITIYDPLSTRLVNGQYMRDAFPGNIIPADRINPIGQRLMSYFPLPNVPGTPGGFNNYVNTPNSQQDQYNSTAVRIDHQLSETQKLNGVWFRNVRNQLNPAAGFPYPATPFTSIGSGYNVIRNNYGGSMDWSDVLSPSLVLDIRYGMIYHPFALQYFGDNFDLASLGFPSSMIAQVPHQTFPGIALSNGYSSIISNSASNTASQYSTSNVHDLSGTISKSTGGHTIKTGGEFYLLRANNMVPVSNFGTFSFDSGFTGQNPLAINASSGSPIASLLLGYPSGGNVNSNIASAFQQLYYGGFLHDDWRVSSRLTLNLGLRWDYESPMSERYYRQNLGFSYDAVNPLQAQVPGLTLKGGLLFTNGVNKLPFKKDLNNYQPRIGAAFRLTENTVLRGGFGIMFTPTFDTGQSNGFSASTSYVASTNGNLTPANSLSNPYPTIVSPSGSSQGLLTLLGQSFTFSDPNRTIPKVYNYSFGVQQQFPGQIVLDVFYAGNYAQSLQVSKGINALPSNYFSLGSTTLTSNVPNPMAGRIPSNSALNGRTISYQNLLVPYPEFGSITQSNSSFGTSLYNSLQVSAQKRLSAGLQFRASFTWSKIMTRLIYLNDQDAFQNLARIQAAEPNKIFVLSGSYALPIFARNTGVLHSLLGGWNINTILRVQAGYLVNAPTGAFSTGVNPKLPDDQQTYSHWFNTCTLNVSGVRTNCASASEPVAWTIQPPFTLNQFRSGAVNSVLPGIRTKIPADLDLSLFKSFAIREAARLEFRAEAFNLTNTPAFGAPNTSVTSSSFGVVTRSQTNDPRLLQLALKLSF